MALVKQPAASTQVERDALTAYLADKPEAMFDDIRLNVAGFDKLADGEIHQIAMDAGFEVEPD